MPLPAENTGYTFADSLTWGDNERAEIIYGEPVMLATPSRVHQEILTALVAQLYNFLEGKQCRVYPAPFAVRLFAEENDTPEETDTVVEPDISVVCDSSKLDQHGCKGVPDFVIEILSPSTQRHDRLVKLGLYSKAGVKEYWIVSPEEKTVQVMLQDTSNGLQLHEVYGEKDVAKVNVLSGCFIELGKVFPSA